MSEDGPVPEVSLQASSPDELALGQLGQHMGYHLVKRSPTVVMVDTPEPSEGKEKPKREKIVLEQLASLDFNSKRKRATLVYKQADGSVWVTAKGADSAMLKLTTHEDPVVMRRAQLQLLDLAERGLRTLVVAEAVKTEEWWASWEERYTEMASLPEKKGEAGHSKGGCSNNCRIYGIFNEIEEAAGLKFLGITAIEDKLQDLVPECIADLLNGGIKVSQ